MYGKLVDGALVIAPRHLIIGQNIVYNPTDEQYESNGYKTVIYTEPGDDPPDGYCYSPYWTEDENTIIQAWELIEETVDAEELLSILTGEAE